MIGGSTNHHPDETWDRRAEQRGVSDAISAPICASSVIMYGRT